MYTVFICIVIQAHHRARFLPLCLRSTFHAVDINNGIPNVGPHNTFATILLKISTKHSFFRLISVHGEAVEAMN
jgi:hypothetical protein